jgi:hypothetical protein
MSEKELCGECREKIIGLFATLTPMGERQVEEVFHCHHEPKEKEKCICLTMTAKEVLGYSEFLEQLYDITCKKCGRKL